MSVPLCTRTVIFFLPLTHEVVRKLLATRWRPWAVARTAVDKQRENQRAVGAQHPQRVRAEPRVCRPAVSLRRGTNFVMRPGRVDEACAAAGVRVGGAVARRRTAASTVQPAKLASPNTCRAVRIAAPSSTRPRRGRHLLGQLTLYCPRIVPV
jgi:hypothetical protein